MPRLHVYLIAWYSRQGRRCDAREGRVGNGKPLYILAPVGPVGICKPRSDITTDDVQRTVGSRTKRLNETMNFGGDGSYIVA
jgi:hypothetical protein